MSEGERWPSDIVEAREAEMLARLEEVAPTLSEERTALESSEHSWGKVLGVTIGVTIGLTVLAALRTAQAAFITAGLGGALSLWAGRRFAQHNGPYKAARRRWSERLCADVLHLHTHEADRSQFKLYNEMGMFDRWETLQSLRSFTKDGRDLIHAHMTKTVTSTDSEGRTTRREVDVFRGLAFTLPFPDAEGDAVTLIHRGGTFRPRGPLAMDGQGRKRGFKPLKTSSLEFNRRHKLRASDGVSGHGILDPDRVMRFIQLEHDLADLVGWGRKRYHMAITGGRAFVVVEGVSLPGKFRFRTGESLSKDLLKVHTPLSIPAVMAHHLRLPPATTIPGVPT